VLTAFALVKIVPPVKTGRPFTKILLALIVSAAIELKLPRKLLIVRVFIKLLTYREEPRPIIEDKTVFCAKGYAPAAAVLIPKYPWLVKVEILIK